MFFLNYCLLSHSTRWSLITLFLPSIPKFSIVLLDIFVVVELLSHVWLFATPWTAACQASLSITNYQTLHYWNFHTICLFSRHFMKNHLMKNFFKFYWSTVDYTMLCYFLLYSKLTRLYVHILFHILFHCGLSQDTEYSSLCYTIGFCCLSIIYMIAWIY